MASPTALASPSTDRDLGPSARIVAVLVALGVGWIFAMQLLAISPSTPLPEDHGGAWHPPASRSEDLVARMDGNAFAQIASDPLMNRTVEDFQGDAGAAAYRASRPLPGWLFAAGSLGGLRVLLAPMMLVLTAATIGWTIFSVDVLGRSLGLHVRDLGALLLSPAIMTAVAYPGIGDPLGLALTLTALAAWFRQRTWAAVALFAAAGLCRETMLLVPLGLALHLMWERRSLRAALPLAIAPLPYLAWVAIVSARIGAAPDSGSQLAMPLSGLVDAIALWHLAEYLTAALLVGATLVIFQRGFGWMKAIAATNLAAASLMGTVVWFQWWGFGRVLTILPILAMVALARPARARAPAVASVPFVIPSPA